MVQRIVRDLIEKENSKEPEAKALAQRAKDVSDARLIFERVNQIREYSRNSWSCQSKLGLSRSLLTVRVEYLSLDL